MSEFTTIEAPRANRSVNERIAVATIIVLLIATQAIYIAKHPITLNAAAELAAFGISAP